MAAAEHVLSFGNSDQLLYIGWAAVTRTSATNTKPWPLAEIQFMRNVNSFLIAISTLFGCESVDNETRVMREAKFQLNFRPAFHESSEITFIPEELGGRVDFLLFKRNSGDNPIDTLRNLSQPISELIFNELKQAVFLRSMQLRSTGWTGCCDGMSIWYSVIQGKDTAVLFLRSPRKSEDSLGYALTIRALYQMRKFVGDSAIRKHLVDVESYIE